MSDNDHPFFNELKRRNVWRIGIAYAITSWLALQVLELVASITGAPEWIAKFVLVVILIGLPVVLLLAWAYEITPEGIKREKDVDRSRSITRDTGQRLDKITIGIFVIAVAWVVADKTLLSDNAAVPVRVADTPAMGQAAESSPGAPSAKSIAVLPFTNMSEDASAGHFSDGLADTVLHKLAQISSLHVAARTSSFQFRGQNVDIREAGLRLGVATILEGSVQAAGNKIRVTAQLIDVSNGYHLWSGNFDRELSDVFTIQDEIAQKVVDALELSLLSDESQRLTKRDTDNVDAFREYSAGIREMDEFSFVASKKAIESFDAAIRIDSGYAMAYAAKARAYQLSRNLGSITDKMYLDGAAPAIEKALELDPQLPEAIAVRADIEYRTGDRDQAIASIEQAVRLGPNNSVVQAIYSRMLARELKFEMSLDAQLKVLELDPLSITAQQRAIGTLVFLRRLAEARELSNRMQTLSPRAPAGYWQGAYVESTSGNWAEAILLLQAAHRADPADPLTTSDLAEFLLAVGLPEVAGSWYAETRRIDPQHYASHKSLLMPAFFADEIDADTIRIARRQLIDDIDEANAARDVALSIIAHVAADSAYYDEYVAWIRHFYPELFDPAIDGIVEDVWTKASFGYAMIQAGYTEQGQKVVELSRERIMNIYQALGRPAETVADFAIASDAGERQAALDILQSLVGNVDLSTLTAIKAWPLPRLDDYSHEAVYQQLLTTWEQRAAEQRARLLELNGGKYPLPENL